MLIFNIGREFADKKELKAISKHLLNNEHFFERFLSPGAVPAYGYVARKIINHWLSEFPLRTTGRNLLEALVADDATLPIAEKYATELVPGLGKFLVFFSSFFSRCPTNIILALVL